MSMSLRKALKENYVNPEGAFTAPRLRRQNIYLEIEIQEISWILCMYTVHTYINTEN